MNNDNSMVAFEEKVTSFQEQNEEVKRVMTRGSDEHLDLMLDFKQRIETLTRNFSVFMEDIIPSTNTLAVAELQSSGIPSLLDLYASSISLVATMKRSWLAADLKRSFTGYYAQVENLHELISDLEIHRVQDNGLEELLADINSF